MEKPRSVPTHPRAAEAALEPACLLGVQGRTGEAPESLRAARWAPSCFNEQPWNFVVCTKDSPEDHERLVSCLSEGTGPGPDCARADDLGGQAHLCPQREPQPACPP